ncbi:aldehyde dehydrogenase family protein [Lacticaseibacillus parakribbianus]|uniref:aldehyde dehydrogenase family protein n=1 Tax=Lacticaseibacillus parakribbianus TaxID=2970927 RepID=UPI0021CAEC62|nr:aldehyde dehydrogenase family protein [Lacticaseibacillus parakribbianus]
MAYTVIDPYTQQQLATYPVATDEQIEATLQRAAAWNGDPAARPQRAQKLAALAAVFEAHRTELAQVATANMGKLHREALGEVQGSIGVINYYAAHGIEYLQPQLRQYQGQRLASISYGPSGVVMAIEPWNFPYTQVMRVFAPNYMVGNPVILKHAPGVAQCAELLVRLVQEAGIAPGAFQNLFLTNDQAAAVIADPRVQGVALTGSVRAGRQVAAEAGAALTKVTLELGGNDAFVVLDDADVAAAADAAVGSRLRNAGQVCVSAKRFIVTQGVAAAFTQAISERFENQVLGDPNDPATTLAPLASRTASQRLQTQVDAALSHGARALVQGGTVAGPGNFFKPVLLTDIAPDNPVFDAELFGPVGQLHVVASDAEAIALANDSQYGLAGTVFGEPTHAAAVAARLDTAQVFVNQQAVAQPELPFGGVKNSGFGREMSEQALHEFAATKVIALG